MGEIPKPDIPGHEGEHIRVKDAGRGFEFSNPLLNSRQNFITSEVTVSTNTYSDITSTISLDKGIWMVFASAVIRCATQRFRAFIAITDGSNNVYAESSNARVVTSSGSDESNLSIFLCCRVILASITNFKLRGARGLSPIDASWIAMDGNGVNTPGHLSNNSDKGTGIFALRVA